MQGPGEEKRPGASGQGPGSCRRFAARGRVLRDLTERSQFQRGAGAGARGLAAASRLGGGFFGIWRNEANGFVGPLNFGGTKPIPTGAGESPLAAGWAASGSETIFMALSMYHADRLYSEIRICKSVIRRGEFSAKSL